jgi:hypothetical protein
MVFDQLYDFVNGRTRAGWRLGASRVPTLSTLTLFSPVCLATEPRCRSQSGVKDSRHPVSHTEPML